MSDLSLRSAIVAMVSAVPGTGKVYNFERFSREMEVFIGFFKNSDGKIYGWELTQRGVPEIQHRGKKYLITHNYVLMGYYGLNDAVQSELSFAAIIDLLLQKFMTQTVPGAALHTHPTVPVQHNRMFGTVLCHYAELAWGVPEICDVLDPTAYADLNYIDGNYYLEPEAGLPLSGDAEAEDLITLTTA